MNLDELPLLPFQFVVEEAVASVALSRALRLRLVSRAFDREVRRAVFRCDAIVDPRRASLSIADHRFLTRLVTARVRSDRLGRLLLTRAIRKVVEFVESEFGPLHEDLHFEYVAALCEAFAWGPRGIGHGTAVIARYITPLDSHKHPDPLLSKESILHGALVAAISTDDIAKVRKLLDLGADPKQDDLPFNRAIDSAARRGLVSMLEVLVANGAEYSPTRHEWQFSHVVAAAEYGREFAVKFLLELFSWSISTTAQSMSFWNGLRAALLSAVRHGHTKIVSRLIDAVEHMAAVDPHLDSIQRGHFVWGRSTLQEAFYEACRSGREDIVQLAITRGALLNKSNTWTHPGIQQASRHGQVGVLRLLVSLGADPAPENKNSHYIQPLCVAAKFGHIDTAQYWLDRGMDVNNRDHSRTPLFEAAVRNEAPMVRFLLSKGADLKEKDCGRRALHYACHFGFDEIVDVLVSNGVDVNGCPDADSTIPEDDFCGKKCTPMIHATLGEHEQVIRLLKWLGARDLDPEEATNPEVRTGPARLERFSQPAVQLVGMAGIR